jgi:hypothetical protein
MRTAGIFAALAVTFVSSHARADSKAWTAAKAGLPADAKLVIGVDFAAIQKTELFATYYPKLLEKAEAAQMISTMKDSCKIDPLTAVQAVVVAMSSDQQDGAIYIAVAGVDRAKLTSCIQLAAQQKADKAAAEKPATDKPAADKPAADKPAKVSVKQDGNLTQITNGADTALFGWVGKDVIVVSIHAQDKASLVKWMGGKGALAKSTLGKSIAKINTSAAVWGAGEETKEVEQGITVKGGYGAVKFAKGSVDADVHAMMENAAQATKMATSANKQLDEAKQGSQLPPMIAGMLKTVTIAAAGDEVVIKATVVEKDLMNVLSLAGLGGS